MASAPTRFRPRGFYAYRKSIRKIIKDQRNLKAEKLRAATASRPPTSSACPLLSSPTELRREVYRYLFEGSSITLAYEDIASCSRLATYFRGSKTIGVLGARSGLHSRMSIMFTCHALYNEAMPAFADCLHLEIKASAGPSTRQIPASLHIPYFSLLQTIRLHKFLPDFDPSQFPRLKQLHLSDGGFICGYDEQDIVFQDTCATQFHDFSFLPSVLGDLDRQYVKKWEEIFLGNLATLDEDLKSKRDYSQERAARTQLWTRLLQDKKRSYVLTTDRTPALLCLVNMGGKIDQGVYIHLVSKNAFITTQRNPNSNFYRESASTWRLSRSFPAG